MALIETHQLSKFYGTIRGIEDVNLSIREGEIFGFIGPNGAGKSTTIRLLLNLIFPTAGSGKIMGMDIVRESQKICRQVGYLPSELHFYSKMTIRELVTYSASFYDISWQDRYQKLINRFEIDETRTVTELSTGNKKKVGILLALLHQPKLLILDEPTSGLDPLLQQRFFETLREEQQQGTTIFFSSHILSDVQRLCNRVAILKDGETIAVENVEALQQKNLKRCCIQWEGKTPKLDDPRIKDLKVHTDRAEFQFTGSPNELIKLLQPISLVDMEIEEPNLEDLFLHYYQR